MVGAAAAVGLAVVFRMSFLGTTPPGLWADEASIGYDAWAIAHFGVDQHATSWPVFFRSFGDFKSPLYVYALAPLTGLFPLTATLVRMPAAILGVTICMVLGITAWRLAGSRWIGLWTFLVAAFTPWLVMQGRVGFEVVVLVLLTAIAVLGAVRLTEEPSRRWAIVVGISLAASPFAYATGRLVAALFAVVLCLVLGSRRRLRPALLWVLPPVAVSYAGLALWAHAHPGALTARFSYLSVFAGSPPLLTAVLRAIRNYVHYFAPPFLAVRGDANLRHNTGAGGMLLWGMLPALLAGGWWCLKRWREPRAQLLLLGLLVAPVPAALTVEGTPHALRSATMLPFVFALAAIGWRQLVRLFIARPAAIAIVVVLLVVQATLWTTDLYRSYPDRALAWFGDGQPEAVVFAEEVRGRGRMFLSYGVGDFVYWYALFTLRPDPRVGLPGLGVQVASAQDIAAQARPGDVAVLGPDDPPPPGATLLMAERPAVGVWLVERPPPGSPLRSGEGARSSTASPILQA
jgi:4-amino-4-deoxy-L-arabinose transferase-like glycosyltransferase